MKLENAHRLSFVWQQFLALKVNHGYVFETYVKQILKQVRKKDENRKELPLADINKSSFREMNGNMTMFYSDRKIL